MSNAAKFEGEFCFPPLFYEALGGKFQPACDPNRRMHTLGRLAYATVTKGTEIEGYDPDASLLGFVYSPSWAPRIQVIAGGAAYAEGRLCVIDSISLNDRRSRSLCIDHFTPIAGDSQEQRIHIGTQSEDYELQLELGSLLEVAQAQVTVEASAFFM